MEYRIERDSMGEMQVPADKYWAAQTQRSFQNFKIGGEKMPAEIIHAFGILKKGAAIANYNLGKLDEEKKDAICKAADDVIDGKLMEHFPLVVWQTGSGTQSNMNSNEVIANRGNEIAGKKLLHPNDHINMSQSSNDTFPTALHIAAAMSIEDKLFPAMDKLIETFKRLEAENDDVVKSGRTHLQDAVPIKFSQEISGWRNMLEKTKKMLEAALPGLKELALGGTAVGTGLNAPAGFDKEVAKVISELTGKDFVTAENKFHALTAKDDITFAHGALKALAADMMKIAKAAWYNPEFRKFVTTQTYEIPPTNKQSETRYLLNHHRMMSGQSYAYDGVLGGKTGYTNVAGNTLVTYAKRGNSILIAVVLNSTNGAFPDTTSLLDYGFDNFEKVDMNVDTNPVPATFLPCEKHLLKNSGDLCSFYYMRHVYVTVPTGTDVSQLVRKQWLLNNSVGPKRIKSKYYFNDHMVGYGMQYEKEILSDLLLSTSF